MADSVAAPLPFSGALTSALCAGIALWTHVSAGKQTAALAVASFALLAAHLAASDRPRFSQLTTSVFGLFYCGYLPSFWVKLRLLSAPAAGAGLAARWPAVFGGPTSYTVGLAATATAVACVAAADTGAYFLGKTLGRTQLTPSSPKKTVEGAAGGAASAVAAALGTRAVLGWPASPAVSVGLGLLVFAASLFGDLLESVMKRDAGLKDAGDLIPGHGGLLDRFDSYTFTGAIVYFVLRFMVPMFGV
jgi:phosphatidate cytidylyltransferase